jgi:hypothetical protein
MLILLAVGAMLFCTMAPMTGKFTRPTKRDQSNKQWRIGAVDSGAGRAVVRAKIRGIEEGQPYTLRLTVVNQASGEQLDLELVDLIATHDSDLDDKPSSQVLELKGSF